MTINEIKKQLDLMTKLEKAEKAVSLSEEVFEANKEVLALTVRAGASFDCASAMQIFMDIAVVASGHVTRSKHNIYTRMCNNLGCTPKSYEESEHSLNFRDQMLGLYDKLVQAVKELYRLTNHMDTLEKFTLAYACLLHCDAELYDEIGETELRLLNTLINDYNDESSTVSSGNQLNMSSSEPEDVQLIKHNAVMARDDNDYVLSVGAELKNPNKNRCARNVRVKIIVKDNAGRILATSENTIEHIDSNAIFYYGDEFSIDRGIPANYTINVNCDGFVGAPENSTFADGITCSHYNLSKDRWDRTIFSGNVHNAYSQRLWTTLFFVFYDSAGNITGGTNTTVTLYGNSDDVFECRLDTTAQRDKVCFSPGFDFTDVV